MAYFLLCGNDKELIADLFCSEDDSLPFTFVSTTDHPKDILRHLKAFTPAALIYCADTQNEESVIKMDSILDDIVFSNTKFIVTGSDEELEYLYPRFGARKIYATISKKMGAPAILGKLSRLANGTDEQTPAPNHAETTGGHEQTVSEDANKAAGSPTSEPLAAQTAQTMQTAQTSYQNEASPAASSSTAEKKKILVIDDDANILRTLKFYLQENYTVAVASSGQVALNFLHENSVDLILLDYMMPIMDGPTVLAKIRKLLGPKTIPVIFLSGLTDREKIKQLISSNVQGYLLKPVDNEKLQEAIRRALPKE